MDDNKKEQYERIIRDKQQMLVLFSHDERLMYEVDEKAERFSLHPSSLKVIIPYGFFKNGTYNENRFLFHLYAVLALYPDYQKNPSQYLNRRKTFSPEAEEMTSYFLHKVHAAGLDDDPAYIPSNVYFHMQDELEEFLNQCDEWISVMITEQKAPVYNNRQVHDDIGQMLLWEDVFPREDNDLAVHRDLAGSLLTAEFFSIDDIGRSSVKEILREDISGKKRFSFLRDNLIEAIRQNKGISFTDSFLHTFLIPCFIKLWKKDIDAMELSKTIEEEQQTDEKRRAKRRSPSQSSADKRRMLQEMKEQKEKQEQQVEKLLKGERDLSAFGVKDNDLTIYRHYENSTRAVRQEMKRYWQKMIGEASRQVNVTIPDSPKGKLDVNTLIQSWPTFTEAERRQNYKELRIFDDTELHKESRVLPRYLDISFVIDNSGSMRSGKIPYARQALAAVLLSLQDFAGCLETNARSTHQQTEVRTEAWLFGTDCRKILSFTDRNEKKRAGIVLAVSRLDGSQGTTDDGNCLDKIEKEITPQMKIELAEGKRGRMIFEVTDGASSFPGSAKKAVAKLKEQYVYIQAIEIGSEKDTAARSAFSYIFDKSGIFLGDDIRSLPDTLMNAVKADVSNIFRK